ncbi:MAG: DUF1566 domain-containing protein [Candidatus Scalindua rubra]|nr:DUF1566 domain-containing protein [Candidatus Scalindua rubra]
MKKHLPLHLLIISFVLLSAPVIIKAEEKSQIVLRSTYRDLIALQVQHISNVFIVNKHNYGFYGHSTIKNSYENKSVSGDSVVTDHTTGLVWHQSGSDEEMDWSKAKQWVKDLNDNGYAGYSDWRLPTVEEAISLLAPNINPSGLYVDPVFDAKQTGIWTGDENDSAGFMDGAWSVRFTGGYGGGNACWVYDNARNRVRPVRSVNKTQ